MRSPGSASRMESFGPKAARARSAVDRSAGMPSSRSLSGSGSRKRTQRSIPASRAAASNRSPCLAAVNAAKDALKGSDTAAIKSASNRLNEVMQSVSAELYKAASGKTQPGQGSQGGFPGQAGQRGNRPESGERKEDDVVDAEVVEEQRR